MLVKLRPSTVYGAFAGGVFVQTPRESFTLRLPPPLVEPACAWIRALEEPRTTADLVAAAGNPKAAPFIERVVAQLREHGALVDAYDVPTGVPTAAVAYVESYSDRPRDALRALVAARVTVTGPEHLVEVARAALAGRGVTATTVPAERAPDTGEWELTLSRPGLSVRLQAAGNRLWITSSGLDDPARLTALRARLTASSPSAALPDAVPDAAAADLAAQLAAEQCFREIAGLGDDAVHTVHVVDSRPLGWRSLELRPVRERADDPAASGPDAPELVGCHRLDTPGDWPQLPLCLSRVVPGPGLPGAVRAAGWGRTRAEADREALRTFLRGVDPAAGAGATPDAALLDAALRLTAERLLAHAGPQWAVGGPEGLEGLEGPEGIEGPDGFAHDGASWRHRVHEPVQGLVFAEVEYRPAAGGDGSGVGTLAWPAGAWGQDRSAALATASATARARAQLDPFDAQLSSSLGVDCRIAEDVADRVPDVRAFAGGLLGYACEFRTAEPDVLLGAFPLVRGTLVRVPRGGR
ncbi:hypothetical protein ACFXJO_22540 [Streptomyces lavendulae]|uniref:hypothetical protein n=1 Tax=Streptomyces lavendulae TaxID=1914 RepID=UPI0036CCBA5B